MKKKLNNPGLSAHAKRSRSRDRQSLCPTCWPLPAVRGRSEASFSIDTQWERFVETGATNKNFIDHEMHYKRVQPALAADHSASSCLLMT